MSALVDAITTLKPQQCSAAKARDALDPESAADFDAWMTGDLVTHDGRPVKLTDARMWIALQTLGFRVAQQTLGRHRRQQGECGCRA